MAASYPAAIKSFSTIVNGVTKLVAALWNSPNDEITAIETELGVDVAGSKSDLVARLTVAINNDGTLKPPLGAWVDVSANVGISTLAPADGFVSVAAQNTAGGQTILGYTDAATPPTTLRCADTTEASNLYAGFTMPVKKGDYYLITCIATVTISWIPLGT